MVVAVSLRSALATVASFSVSASQFEAKLENVYFAIIISNSVPELMKVIVLVKREEMWIEDDSDCSTRISTRSTIRIAIFMQFLHHGCNFKLW